MDKNGNAKLLNIIRRWRMIAQKLFAANRLWILYDDIYLLQSGYYLYLVWWIVCVVKYWRREKTGVSSLFSDSVSFFRKFVCA